MLSAMACAILPSVLAVQGATSMASAHSPSATCECHVPPFIVATDNPVRYGGVNETLLKSSGTTDKVIGHIANAYRLVFHGQTSVFDAVIQIKEQVPEGKEVNAIIEFIKGTQLGIIGKI